MLQAGSIVSAAVLIVILLLLIVLQPVPLSLEVLLRPRTKAPFSNTWFSTNLTNAASRYPMANELVSSGTLIGLKTTDVQAMLGPADYETKTKAGGELSYSLAHQHEFPPHLHSVLFMPSIGIWVLRVHIVGSNVVEASIAVN